MEKQLQVIGRNVLVDFIGHKQRINSVPAKIDTGADSSSVWASNISVTKKGTLKFTLFDEGSEYYTGEVIRRRSYRVAVVRSSSGHEQIRYKVEIPVRVAGKRLRAGFYLSDRSANDFPILLGRRTLNKKFLVDVSVKEYHTAPRMGRGLYAELMKDPYAFHQKYHQNEE
jgi:hypothetical protein